MLKVRYHAIEKRTIEKLAEASKPNDRSDCHRSMNIGRWTTCQGSYISLDMFVVHLRRGIV